MIPINSSRSAPILLATYLRLGSIAQAGLAKRHDPATIARLD